MSHLDILFLCRRYGFFGGRRFSAVEVVERAAARGNVKALQCLQELKKGGRV